ncbi:hypothetical protein KFK09_024577 [Dendrobium nobile]|uniref:Uncharacterized protein n=1 Tax=Dendrobium nobile TaxID=94219 RepID=A0A8T3AE75_DENNO|nr:hypothetical protein KFK09_024577 [Dendrobium nobile]
MFGQLQATAGKRDALESRQHGQARGQPIRLAGARTVEKEQWRASSRAAARARWAAHGCGGLIGDISQPVWPPNRV